MIETSTSTTSGVSTVDPEPVDGDPCVVIEHRSGTTCVPATPSRIVAVDPVGALPTLLAAEAPVVGAITTFNPSSPWPSYFDVEAVAGVELVGSAAAPNYEAIAALEPDLIVAGPDIADYDILSAIAPTVVFATFYTDDWVASTRAIAQAAGVDDTYDAVLQDVLVRIEALGDRYASLGDTFELTRVDDYGGTFFVYEQECLWYGTILSALGISQPVAQQDGCTTANPFSAVTQVSAERFDLLDADAIFVYADANPTGGGIPATTTNVALWEGLRAVEAGRTYPVSDAWGLGGNVWAVQRVLDDLERLADELLDPAS